MTRFHVLHVAEPPHGGVARYVAQIAQKQQSGGWSVTIATPPQSVLFEQLAGSGITIVPWSAVPAPSLRLGLELVTLARIVRRVRPNVVHLHSSKAGLVGRLLLRGRIPTLHQPHAWPFSTRHRWLTRLLMAWEAKAGDRWSTRIICVSDEEQEEGQAAGVRTSRMLTVANGVDLQAFPAAGDEDRRAAREALGLPECPLVVCVARLHRQKGQQVLLEAWPHVKNALPEARLALVGDGPDQETLRRRADDTVILPGATADPWQWYAAADVVVLPSLWEGLALTSLEALASARPLIMTNVNGSRIVTEAGAGEVVQVGDVVGLGRAVLQRLADGPLRRSEGLAGRSFVEQHHDINKQVDDLCRVTLSSAG